MNDRFRSPRSFNEGIRLPAKLERTYAGSHRICTTAHGHLQHAAALVWRATTDDDEHYVYAIAL
jgi:hypothetical protein